MDIKRTRNVVGTQPNRQFGCYTVRYFFFGENLQHLKHAFLQKCTCRREVYMVFKLGTLCICNVIVYFVYSHSGLILILDLDMISEMHYGILVM